MIFMTRSFHSTRYSSIIVMHSSSSSASNDSSVAGRSSFIHPVRKKFLPPWYLGSPKSPLLNVQRSFETCQVAFAPRAKVIRDMPSRVCSTCKDHSRRAKSPLLNVQRSFETCQDAFAQRAKVIRGVASALCSTCRGESRHPKSRLHNEQR